MLDDFREIYDRELETIEENWLEHEILNMPRMRAFVYEICKHCVESEFKLPHRLSRQAQDKRMTCHKIKGGFACDFAQYRNYICFEHTTYLFEFGRFGPAWFTVPGDEYVYAEPDGHMSVLWDMFEKWFENYKS